MRQDISRYMVRDDEPQQQQSKASSQNGVRCPDTRWGYFPQCLLLFCSLRNLSANFQKFQRVSFTCFTAPSFLCPFEVKTERAVKSNMLLKHKKLQKFYHKLGVSPKHTQYTVL